MLTVATHQRFVRPVQQSLRPYSANAAAEELVFPELPTSNHHDLPSFLDYASRTELNPKSTTYVGTHYEFTVQTALEKLGMSLKRTGGKSDYGIDLLGTWPLPSAPFPLKVLIQCKALARKLEPAQARELEGAFVGAPTGWRGSGVLGLLVSKKPATKGVREAIGKSRWPMGYVLCENDGKILQLLWNQKAEQDGLLGIEVGVKYRGGEQSKKEIILSWEGKAIKP